MNMKLEGLIFGILALLTIASVVISVICLLKIKTFQSEIIKLSGKKTKKSVNNDFEEPVRKRSKYKKNSERGN